MSPPGVQLLAVSHVPFIKEGDDLAELIIAAASESGIEIRGGDILVVAQKIVSKSEGRGRPLNRVTPSPAAVELAATVRKDPRLVELILAESRSVVRAVPNVLITEHRLGFIMANAGIDQSNVEAHDGPVALLLPESPDKSCTALRNRIESMLGVRIAVMMNDSFGRPWRNGVTGVCLGASGLAVLLDRRGSSDLFGRELEVTMVAAGDELAAAASLVMGQGNEGIPAVIVRGYAASDEAQPASALIRPRDMDLFR